MFFHFLSFYNAANVPGKSGIGPVLFTGPWFYLDALQRSHLCDSGFP